MVQRYCFFFIYMVDEFVHHICGFIKGGED